MKQARIELISGYYFEQSRIMELPDWLFCTPFPQTTREWWVEEREARRFAADIQAHIIDCIEKSKA